MAKSLLDKAIELKNWKTFVENMDALELNENYEYSKPKNKYYRFTDHMKCWIQGLLGVREEDGSFLLLHDEDMTEEERSWEIVRRNSRELNTNWWKVALNGKGKTDKPLPIMNFTTSEEDVPLVKDQIYATLLPAYRALKESYDKRWAIEWIFNHRQYTAERDTMNVLKNLMISLTGDSVEAFEERYEAYKVELPTSNPSEIHRIDQERAAIAKRMKENAIMAEEEKLREKAMEDLKAFQEEQKKEEIEQIMQKEADELTMKDQLSICTQDETFKKKVTDDLKAALAGKANPALLKIMATSHVYNPLLAAAEKFCQDFDLAVENGHSKDDLEKLVSDGAKNVFGVALGAAKNLKVSGAKDCIIVAQKLADIMLNSVSPVAFKQNEYRAFGKAYMVMKNADAIAEMVDGGEAAMNDAIKGAQEEFGKLYPKSVVKESEQLNIILSDDNNIDLAPPVEYKGNENGKDLSSYK